MTQSLDPRLLVRALTAPTRKALERAVARTVEQRRLDVEVEDLLICLLEQADSDVAELLRRSPVDTTALRGAVEAALQLRPTGSTRPTFAGALMQALGDARLAGQRLGGSSFAAPTS